MAAEPHIGPKGLQRRDIADRARITHIGDEDGRSLGGERFGGGPAGDAGTEHDDTAPPERVAHPEPPRAMKSA